VRMYRNLTRREDAAKVIVMMVLQWETFRVFRASRRPRRTTARDQWKCKNWYLRSQDAIACVLVVQRVYERIASLGTRHGIDCFVYGMVSSGQYKQRSKRIMPRDVIGGAWNAHSDKLEDAVLNGEQIGILRWN